MSTELAEIFRPFGDSRESVFFRESSPIPTINAGKSRIPQMPNTINKTQIISAIVALASTLHAKWRVGFEASKGKGAQRWKPTFEATVTPGEFIRPAGDGFEVNINQDFATLPVDWQLENNLAAGVAVNAVLGALAAGLDPKEPAVVDSLCQDYVHQSWVARRNDDLNAEIVVTGKSRDEVVATTNAGWFIREGLNKPFDQLPEAEKDKDREHIIEAVKALGL
jgi:hypothetical protein